ncbi:MAG: protein-disulfide reductase DsbD [Gammaproteobacteria bacterium]|jgi:thioredoxin:protein disulfide reductase|nr:protein-disulfide reductase DsbD [Gammaproteobacteria bacterium]
MKQKISSRTSLSLVPLLTLLLSLMVSSVSLAEQTPIEQLGGLIGSFGLDAADDDPLHPDKAFVFSHRPPEAGTIELQWDIADEHYLYRNKFKFKLSDAVNLSLGEPELPPGELKEDQFFGTLEVYHNSKTIHLPLIRASREAASGTLRVIYQGCAERGICYPPISKRITLDLPALPDDTPANPSANAPTPTTGNAAALVTGGATTTLSEQDQIAASLSSGNTLLTLLSFFGFGLLLAFTPCIFPMIPILSGIIVGQGEEITTRRAFTMSLVYVLAMALTYTFAGVLAGLFGENLQAAFQNPWILGTFSIVFVLLSLSMFGFYDLQMPASIQSKLANASNRQKGGSLTGVAIMGLLSALIVGPCVAAPLAGALIYIGQTGDALLGGMALFALSIGMGLPLLVIGTSAGKLLPRAGGWMDAIKAIFGVLLLAVAVWMLERILPAPITLALWAMLLIVPAVYMGALEPLPSPSSGWKKLWKGVGLLLFIYGTLLLIGVASGGSNLFQPLKGLGGGAGSVANEQHLTFQQIKGVKGLEQALATAKKSNQPVFLDFYADWCISCKEFESLTFTDAGVQQALAPALLIQADVTANDAEDQALMKKLGIFGPPALLFFDRSGQEVSSARLVQFMSADQFAEHVRTALQ